MHTRHNISIAEHIVTLRVPPAYDFLLQDRAFSLFSVQHTAKPDAKIIMRVLSEEEYPETIAQRYRASHVNETNRGTAARANFFDPSTCTLDSWGLAPDHPRHMLKGLTALLLGSLAADRGGLLLHGAGFVIDNLAGAFIGLSGAGKSTGARLVRPDRLLSDDVVIASDVAARPVLHATPLGRVSDGPGAAPLTALFLPRKRADFSLTRLTPREALARCTAEQYPVFTSVFKPYIEQSFRNLNRLVKTVPCYEMGFSLDAVDRAAIRRVLTDPLPLP
jgi:hypothetical protein